MSRPHLKGGEKAVRMPIVGEVVKWHNPVAVEHDALVTCVFTATLVNVVVVSKDAEKTDSYGRQIERYTSQSHKSVQPAHGFYWRFADEEPNPIMRPLET